jgi:hypothetical protein
MKSASARPSPKDMHLLPCAVYLFRSRSIVIAVRQRCFALVSLTTRILDFYTNLILLLSWPYALA